MTTWWMAAAGAYLLGSLPWGLWLGRLRGRDVRRAGSGNLGATNVARLLGYRMGALVLALDAAKGFLAVALGRAAPGGEASWLFLPSLCGALAVLGHATTPWAGFRGGKGVATAAGAAALLMPVPLVVSLAVFIAVFAAGRIVSLASLAAALALPISASLLGTGGAERPWHIAWSLVVALLVLWRHAGNIGRLARGQEPRLRLGNRDEAPGARPSGTS